MKIATAAFAAIVLAGLGWGPPAHAQGVPNGSYLRSCSNTAIEGDALVATCRREGGREQTSRLAGVRNCVGDVGNNNGVLQCSLKGGNVARGQVVAGPGPGRDRGPGNDRGPGYDRGPVAGPGYVPGPGAVPSYGAPPPGWEHARWERCHHTHERVEELRVRLDRTYDREERARLEGRLHELRREEDRCR